MFVNIAKITQKFRWSFLILGFFIVAPFTAGANTPLIAGDSSVVGFEDFLRKASLVVALLSGLFVFFLIIVSLISKKKNEIMKKILFVSIAGSVLVPTLFFVGSTLYLNMLSETRGPIHWHADFGIYTCGTPVVLRAPEGLLSNKVGTPLLHHHDDNRMHVEGTVLNRSHITLAWFFNTIGGILAKTSFSIPTETGTRTIQNGELCNGNPGLWQVFVYTQDAEKNSVFRQRKLDEFENYVLSPETQVPPGDCIIMEFDTLKERTEHLCPFYEIAKQKGAISIESS